MRRSCDAPSNALWAIAVGFVLSAFSMNEIRSEIVTRNVECSDGDVTSRGYIAFDSERVFVPQGPCRQSKSQVSTSKTEHFTAAV